MRFDCGLSFSERIDAKSQWHTWFAWYPVRVGHRDCRWLERVERKGTFYAGAGHCWWSFTYRPSGATK